MHKQIERPTNKTAFTIGFAAGALIGGAAVPYIMQSDLISIGTGSLVGGLVGAAILNDDIYANREKIANWRLSKTVMDYLRRTPKEDVLMTYLRDARD